MNKYIFLATIFFVNVSSASHRPNLFDERSAAQKIQELPFERSLQARLISRAFINDENLAARYIKNAEFYGRRSQAGDTHEKYVDLVIYPVVDIVVGNGMKELDQYESVHNTMHSLSRRDRKFVSDNTQLIVSAAVLKAIKIESGKGLGRADSNDAKEFAKSCAAQVGCDAMDEYVVKPVVKMLVDDQKSWTACGLRFVGNFVLGQYVINKVSKL